MSEAFSVTQILAILIGLYFLAAGIGLITDSKTFAGMMKTMKDQPVFGYLGGLIAFAVGGAIVATHNDWSSVLSGFVSLIGWVALIEGILLIAFRKWFVGLFTRLNISAGFAKLMGIGTAIAGAVLIYAGIG